MCDQLYKFDQNIQDRGKYHNETYEEVKWKRRWFINFIRFQYQSACHFHETTKIRLRECRLTESKDHNGKLKKYGLFNEFDFVFIDTPPTMSSLVQEGIAASDYYLIPTKPEFLAIEGVAQAMSFAKTTLKNIPNVNAIFLGVLLNQVETRRASYEEFLSELEYLLGDRLFKTKISHLTEIADSPFYGKTVIDFNKESKARIQFNKLAEEIIERVDKNEEIT